MKNMKKLSFTILLLAGLIIFGCDVLFDPDSSSSSSTDGKLTITPSSVTLARGETQQFNVDQSYVSAWSLEGATGSSSINNSGLLTIGNDETASTLTVRVTKSYYTDGTAKVTVAAPSATPQDLKVSKPSAKSIALSWTAMSGVSQYTVQRSTNGKDFGQIDTASGTTYTDTTVAENTSYYYRIQANGVNSQVIYAFAQDYFNMPTFAQRKLIPLSASNKHYYRFAVNAGSEYTIEWQDGNNADPGGWNWGLRVSAYQNNGTSIFSEEIAGYTSPKVFTATATGFVTIVVRNGNGSGIQDYQIYCYGSNGADDNGTVPLPPYKVNAFRVSSPTSNSITLSWDSVSDAVKYNIYRSNTQTGTLSRIGESNGTSYNDSDISAGVSYWYTIAAVNAGGLEGCRLQGAFAFAASHYTLSYYSNTQLLSLAGNDKHYYRLSVIQGTSYTIEWQDGNNADPGGWNWGLRVSAYQNNGTSIFSEEIAGYTSPKVFTATATGFVTIVVRNGTSSGSQNYKIYYY